MAISSTTATVPSFNLDRSIAFDSSKLSALSSLRFPQSRRIQTWNRKSYSIPHRHRVLPRVQAKKQTFSSFDELLANSDKPVLVDFYATWCGPCQYMGPILDQVSVSLKDKIQVVKIDTEKYTSVADKYRIQALPTFIIFKDGEPCDRFVSQNDRFEGALPADQLIERIENALKVAQ